MEIHTNTTRTCEVQGCTGPGLMFTEPVRCSVHVRDLDEWFESAKPRFMAMGEPAGQILASLASEVYKSALIQRGPSRTLYAEFKNEIDPRPEVSFSFENLVYFAIGAAASGILGNAAYDSVKMLVRRLSRKTSAPVAERFDQVVTVARYERLRIERYGQQQPTGDLEERVVLEIERRYRLLVTEEGERDS